MVSSALRLTDADVETTLGRALGEAVLLSALLAACKPGYIVLAACYLLPLLGRRRRTAWWPLVFAPVVGVIVSVLWNEAVGGLWRTDADFFGVGVDPARQRSLLLHEPWTFLVAAGRTVGEDLWDWGKGLITLGPSVRGAATWSPSWSCLRGVGARLGAARCPRAAAGSIPCNAAPLVIVFVVGCLLVLGAQYVYWSVPGADVVGGMQARFFVPLLVLVPIVVLRPPSRRTGRPPPSPGCRS